MTDTVRLFDIAALDKPGRRPTTHCWCGEAASDGKDRCYKHVLERPYAAAIVATLEARDDEIRRTLRRGPRAIPEDSIVLDDLRALLYQLGGATIDRLSFHYHHELAAAGGRLQRRQVLHHYMTKLVRLGHARWVSGKRVRNALELLTPPEALSA